MKKVWIWLLAVSLQAGTFSLTQHFNVKTVTVSRIETADAKTYYGRTAVDESRVVDVTLRFDAYVTKLYANRSYQYVKEGSVLFDFYAKEVVSVIEELRLARRLSASALQNSRRKLRLLGLSAKSVAKADLQAIPYPSPASGYIIRKEIREGSFAKAGALLLQIADFSSLWVIADIYQSDIARVRMGMAAKIHVAGYGMQEGVVEFIYPKVDTKKQTVPVRIRLEKNHTLFPGLFAKVSIVFDRATRLVLPKTAVIQRGEKYYVFIPQGQGRFVPKEIAARRLGSGRYEILSGLSEGDLVADKALFLLDSDALTNALYESDEDEDW